MRSRCQEVVFEPLPPEAVEAMLAETGADESEARAAARLCGGDAELARFLLTERGLQIRAQAERCARGRLRDDTGGSPWRSILEQAESAGTAAGEAAEAALVERAEAYGKAPRRRAGAARPPRRQSA